MTKHEELDAVVFGFIGQYSVRSFISPFSYAHIRPSSCRRIQLARLSRARRQRYARIPAMQNAQYETEKDEISAVSSTSENEQASVKSQRPILQPPPRRNVKRFDGNGTSLSLQSVENGKGTGNTAMGIDPGSSSIPVPDELDENSDDFDEDLDTGISEELENIDDGTDKIKNNGAFSSSFRKAPRNSRENSGSRPIDIFPRREFGAEQRTVDEVEKRLRNSIAEEEQSKLQNEERPFSGFGNSEFDENDSDFFSEGDGTDVNELSLSEALRQEGHIAESKGHHSLAGAFYLRSIQYNINNGKAWQNLAKSEGRRKQSMRASAHVLRRALEHNPKNAFLWQSLGFLLFRMRQYESARMHFEKGIAVDPDHAPLYSTWAHMEYGMKEIERARELYEKGSRIEKGGARVFQNWGQMEEKLGHSEKAMQLYERGLEMEPSNPFLLETLAIIAARNQDFDQARDYFRVALQSEEHRASVCESFAEMEGRLGNHDEARRLFEQGVSSDVKNSRVLRTWSTFELKVSFFFSLSICVLPILLHKS